MPRPVEQPIISGPEVVPAPPPGKLDRPPPGAGKMQPVVETGPARSFVRSKIPSGRQPEWDEFVRQLDEGPKMGPVTEKMIQHQAHMEGLIGKLTGRDVPDESMTAGRRVVALGEQVDLKMAFGMNFPVPIGSTGPTHMFGADMTNKPRHIYANNDPKTGWLHANGELVDNVCLTGKMYLEHLNLTGLINNGIVTFDLAGIGRAGDGSGLSKKAETPEGRNTVTLVNERFKGLIGCGLRIFGHFSGHTWDHVKTCLSKMADELVKVDVPVDLETEKGSWQRIWVGFGVPTETGEKVTIVLCGNHHFSLSRRARKARQTLNATSILAAIRGIPINAQHIARFYDKACRGFLSDEEWMIRNGETIAGLDGQELAMWQRLLSFHGSPFVAWEFWNCWKSGQKGGECFFCPPFICIFLLLIFAANIYLDLPPR